MSILVVQPASAQIAINVASGADLVSALTTVSSNPGNSYRINFTQSITLDSGTTLPAINTSSALTISGNNKTLDGAGVQRGFLVYRGPVAISDLAITNARAVGGNGGEGESGGGGGMGAGGALFVASGGSVSVSNVQLNANSAKGGNGGDTYALLGSGGGGGLGGNGGSGASTTVGSGAGGGGVGIGATGGDVASGPPGSAGIILGAAGGGAAGSGAAGGANGGGGGASNVTADGGGGGGVGGGAGANDQNASHYGGPGGFGGGGGGGRETGGAGGFGGGGGAGSGSTGKGGDGGFGGGGGGMGVGGFGGGYGSSGGCHVPVDCHYSGGGGLGAGGAIFVQEGGSLSVLGPLTIAGNSVSGGAPGRDTTSVSGTGGMALGTGLFLQGNGSLRFSAGIGETQTISDVIADQTGSGGNDEHGTAGSWSVALNGAGSYVLSSGNAYSGGTTLTQGSLIVGNNLALGTGPLAMASGTSLSFASGGSFTVSNGIVLSGSSSIVLPAGTTQRLSGAITDGSAAGSLDISGTGTLVLSGANGYSGGTTLSASSLVLGSDTALGTGALAMAPGTNLSFLGNSNLTVANTIAISGNASITPPAGTTQQLTGPISDGGTVGSLTVAGGGTLVLAGGNSYSGGTTLSAGTLGVANQAAFGTGGLAMAAGTTLSFVSGSYTINNPITVSGQVSIISPLLLHESFGGVIADGTAPGGLTLSGTGSINLMQNNSYTGPTNVNAVTLELGGSIAASSLTTVNNGGILTYTGTVGNTLINSGGKFAPGNVTVPGTTMTVAGNLTIQPGATYQVQVGPAAATRAVVSGTATLNGGTVEPVARTDYIPADTYTILTATGGVSGAFDSVKFYSGYVVSSLSYDANNVYLTLITDFTRGPQTRNQRGVGAALNSIGASGNGAFQPVLGAVSQLDSQQGPAVLDSLSGVTYSGFATTMVQGAQSFMNNVAAQAGSAGGGTRAMLAEACDVACDPMQAGLWGVWGGAVGGLGSIGNGQSTGAVTYNSGGFAAGIDRQLSDSFRAGVTVGYTTGTQWVSGYAGRGTSDTFLAGVYGSFTRGPLYVDGLAGYAYSDNQSSRPISIPGLQPVTARGQTGANQFYGQIETGYRFDAGGTAQAYVTPFARLQGFTAIQNAFTETGAGAIGLNVAGQTTNSLRSVFGAILGGSMDMGWREKIAAQVRLGWSHEYASVDRPVTATFTGAPTIPFTTFGVTPQRNGVLLGLSADTAVAEGTRLYLRYEGNMAAQDSAHTMTVGMRVTW